MKIRNGFVSNSSSSSFLIKTDGDYKTVYDVAKRIMLDMQSQWSNDECSYSDELSELEKMSDKNTPVFFDSSDGGYIRKFKDYIIVSTTQHYDPYKFDIVNFKDVEEEYFKELEYKEEGDDYYYNGVDDEERIRKITSCEDFDYYWQQFDDFLLLKSGIYGVWQYDFKNGCPDCGRNPMGSVLKLKNGETICGCKATKKYARKLKLKEIENEN